MTKRTVAAAGLSEPLKITPVKRQLRQRPSLYNQPPPSPQSPPSLLSPPSSDDCTLAANNCIRTDGLVVDKFLDGTVPLLSCVHPISVTSAPRSHSRLDILATAACERRDDELDTVERHSGLPSPAQSTGSSSSRATTLTKTSEDIGLGIQMPGACPHDAEGTTSGVQHVRQSLETTGVEGGVIVGNHRASPSKGIVHQVELALMLESLSATYGEEPLPTPMFTKSISSVENAWFDIEYATLQRYGRMMGQHGILGMIAARNLRRSLRGE